MNLNAKNLVSLFFVFNVNGNLTPHYDKVYMQLVLEYIERLWRPLCRALRNVPYCINTIIFDVF